MPQIFMIIVSVVLHQLLGWPLLVGVLIAALIATIPELLQLLSQTNPDNKLAISAIALKAIAGMLIGVVVTYVPIVLVYFFTGHPSW
jgi:hypothetical protein